MLRKADGTPYVLGGTLQQYNPTSVDLELFNRLDAEIIQLSGSPIYYYEVFIQDQTIDPIYLEDRGKLFSNFPIQLFAIYEPPQQATPSGMFGIDTPGEEVIFELNYQATLKAVNHLPKRGSRIFTPHLRENWIIIDTKLGEFKKWHILRLFLHCGKFQESLTTGEGQVTQPLP